MLPVCMLLPWLLVTESPPNLSHRQESPDSYFPWDSYNSFNLLRWGEMLTEVDRAVDITAMSQGPGLSTAGAAESTSKLCRNAGTPWGCVRGDSFILLENGSGEISLQQLLLQPSSHGACV